MKSVLHLHFDTIESTNTWAEQNKKWYSPQDQNLYAIFCSFFDIKRGDTGNFPEVLALASLILLYRLKKPFVQFFFVAKYE